MASLFGRIPYVFFEKSTRHCASPAHTNQKKNCKSFFLFRSRDSVSSVQSIHPAIEVKDAILARSGIYVYWHDELVQGGVVPTVKKELYKVYRPAAVLVKAKDKFPFAVVTKEHCSEYITPENFREQVDGIVGDSVEVVALENGEIGLKGKIAFYTKDVADYFNGGNKETSADYKEYMVEVNDNADYDFVMTEIISVNGIAITSRGRGGSTVRVLDSIETVIEKRIGGTKMGRGNILSALFGIGRTKDAAFKLSNVVMGSVAKVHTLDAAGLEKEVDAVMACVKPLGEGKYKDLLVGAVSDSFKHPVEVLAKKQEVSDVLDKLYARCQDADEQDAKDAVEELEAKAAAEEKTAEGKKAGEKKSEGEESKEKEPGEEEAKKTKEAAAKDTAAIIDEAVQKAVVGVKDSIEAMVDASVNKALGIQEKKSGVDGGGQEGHITDSVCATDLDSSFLFQGVFGTR